MSAASPYDVRTFEEFWPHYVRMHTRRETHALHAAGTLSFVVLAGLGVARRSPLFLLAAPLADYVLAQTSHRVFEGNVTEPWRNHAWHARAELRMLRLVLAGRMKDEVREHAGAGTRKDAGDSTPYAGRAAGP